MLRLAPPIIGPKAASVLGLRVVQGRLLIDRVVIADGGLEIIWRDQGWQDLAGELLPGTIGAELQEWEQTEEMA